MEKKVLVIGSLNMDLSVNVDAMPAVGETVLGHSLLYRTGGKGANQACAIGKLGCQVRMLGCVGRDDFGNRQMKSLASSGVDVSQIRVVDDLPTGTAVICVDSRGDNSIVVIPGANQGCDTAYLQEQEDAFSWCDYVVLQMEIPYEAVVYAAKRARELGKTVILNPAPAPDELSDELLRNVDYLTPNETELMKLSGLTDSKLDAVIQGARYFLHKGTGCVLTTLGAQGALLVKNNSYKQFPARSVSPVDTTAAGDCFNGAFTAALAEGKTEEAAVEWANVAASIAVTRKGAQESLPVREEVESAVGNL